MKNRPARLRIIAVALVVCGTTVSVAGTVSASTTAVGHSSGPVVTAATANKVPVVINCSGNAQVRPRSYVFACADGNDYLAGLRWASWGATSATASGSDVLNDCVPSCVAGHFHGFQVLAVLWRAEPLPGHSGERYFTRVTLIYTADRSYRAGGRLHRLPVTSTNTLSASGGL